MLVIPTVIESRSTRESCDLNRRCAASHYDTQVVLITYDPFIEAANCWMVGGQVAHTGRGEMPQGCGVSHKHLSELRKPTERIPRTFQLITPI